MKNKNINYWNKNVTQTWYSDKEKYSIQWFNELSQRRYQEIYEYKYKFAEFPYHGGEKVLDIGCGPGTDAVEYAKNGSFVSAIDLNEEQINLTKKNFEVRKLKYENIMTASTDKLPFDDKIFDLIYCDGVLHHVPEIEKSINEIFRVLKDDGKALIILYRKGWKHYFKRILIHGILKLKIFKYKFDFLKLTSEVSEVNGNTPLTRVLSKKEVKNLFARFGDVKIERKRLGEFFDYAPYNSFIFPRVIKNIVLFLGLDYFLAEHWAISLKKGKKHKEKLKTIIFDKF